MSATVEDKEAMEPTPARPVLRPAGGPIALYTRSVRSGQGAEKVIVNLARGLARRGHAVDLLLEEPEGVVLDDLPSGVSVVVLQDVGLDRLGGALARLASLMRTLAAFAVAGKLAVPGLASALLRLVWSRRPALHPLNRYLREARPTSVTAFLNYPSLALMLASVPKGTRRFVSVRNHVTTASAHARSRWVRDVPVLMAGLYGRADCVIAVSDGVRADVARITGLAAERLKTIHNPYFLDDIAARAAEPSGHPWLDGPGGPPVLVAAGKLRPQKDFPTLVKAFASVRQHRPARLVILGEGEDREALEGLARDLGVADDVDMPGHVDNPYAYFGRAAAFVLSSAWEGFPNVLVEAMASGAPVVSTDCPSGPSEILDQGQFGPLVPVGDVDALAEAIRSVLAAPPDRAASRARTKSYDAEVILAQYETLLAAP